MVLHFLGLFYSLQRGSNGFIAERTILSQISYKIIANVGINTKFSYLFETFGSMSEIMFSNDSLSKQYFFQQLKKHECLLSFSTSLLWIGGKTMVQKFENDRNFLLYHC